MATATIRVSTDTRDELAAQARARGVSLAAFLAALAEENRREAVWQSERTATAIDANSLHTACEIADWDATLGDGLDD